MVWYICNHLSKFIYTLTRSVALVSYRLIITRQIAMATRQQSYKTQNNHYADALRYALEPLICKIPDLRVRRL